MNSLIEKIRVEYNKKQVIARKLTVSSILPISIDTAWAKVQTPELFEFITKGKLKLIPVDRKFPDVFEEGDTIEARILIYGIIPFGGIHTLYFEKIDSGNHIIKTKEKDAIVKVWNHKISMNAIDDNCIKYEDEITIYADILTCVITLWAKSFYKYRQRRWLEIAYQVDLKGL